MCGQCCKALAGPTQLFTLLAAQEQLSGLSHIPASSPPSSCTAVTHTKSSCPVLACSGVRGELGQCGCRVSPVLGPPGSGLAGGAGEG